MRKGCERGAKKVRKRCERGAKEVQKRCERRWFNQEEGRLRDNEVKVVLEVSKSEVKECRARARAGLGLGRGTGAEGRWRGTFPASKITCASISADARAKPIHVPGA